MSRSLSQRPTLATAAESAVLSAKVDKSDAGAPQNISAFALSGTTYIEATLDQANRMIEGIKDDGTKHVPVLQTELLTIGTSSMSATTPPAFDTVGPDGSGYQFAMVDPAGRVFENAVGEDGRAPDWVIAAQKMRAGTLSDPSFPMDIIVGAGQSNMGSTPDPIISAIDLDNVDPRIYLWSSTEGLVRFSDSVNRRVLTPRVILSFASEYARTQLAPGRNVLIVNGALGSTGFSTSSIVPTPAGYVAGPGTWDRTLTADPVNLYTQLVSWTNTAKSLVNSNSTLVALLISLGETDSDPGNKTQSQFAALLDDMIAQFRTDMSAPSLPVIIGSMQPDWTDASATRIAIARAHEDTPRRVERAAYAWGPPDMPDWTGNVHWSAQGQIARGPIFFQAYKRSKWNVNGTEPLPPQNLTARRTGGNVLVSWEHPPSRINSFTLQYRIDGGTWTTVTLLDATSRSATLSLALAPTSTIGLQISTTNSVGTSNYSREVQA